ncbi:MAG: glycosyltransferase [Armatimonadota bacterium]|nr:glycosyltransferase [Armatimonadota bacterium]MDR7544783.1 glycosyltransferase [Armatimonadota bacterium]
MRTAVQISALLALTRISHRVFVTIDPRLLDWARRAAHKVRLLPVGSNIPVSSNCQGNRPGGDGLVIAVFGITEGLRGDGERKTILDTAAQAAQEVGPVTVVAFGRGTAPTDGAWPWAPGVTVEARGIVASGEASGILERADAMLFVRGGLSSRRGTAMAGIAHGLPVVGFRTAETGWPMTEAGVVLVEPGDQRGLAEALVRLRRDPAFAAELRARSRRAYERYFSWSAIAARFLEALEEA